MSNILIVMPNDTLGGAEQYLKMVANYFKDSNVFVCFLKASNTGHWEDLRNNIKLVHLSKRSYGDGGFKLLVFALHNRTTFDYIFSSHLYINAIVGGLISLNIIKTKKFIARESTSVFPRYHGFKLLTYKLAYKLGYRNMDVLICQTNQMKSQLLSKVPYLDKRTLVKTIPNPIDLNKITHLGKSELDFIFPKEYIVSAGRFIKEKGFDILIKSFSEIKKEYPNLKLVILGEGPLKDSLKILVSELNVTKDVVFAGFVNNVYPYFRHARVCVVSSRLEGFPNVLLQMMSQNNNVVSAKCAGGIENIPGIITSETNNQNSLTAAILLGLSNFDNKENRRFFGDYLKERDISQFMINILSNN